MATAVAEATQTRFDQIEIERIESSGLNPRTHWNDADDQELQASIRVEGVLEPIMVRPHPKKHDRFQVVAGERRFKAAKAVGLGLLPAIVREVSDEKLIELALTENIQRRSMHPLDEANGFIKRLEMGHSSPEQLAAALGLSARYVSDRIRLKKLGPKAIKMLEAGTMTVSHAIILAKLDAKVQDQAINDCTEYAFDFDNDKAIDRLQSVGDLKLWVSQNVRLDITSPEVQAEFPEVAEEVAAAAAKGATVVMLSEERTPYLHKAKPGDPLFADKWQACKKTDKAAQTGVIVEGRNRGQRVYFKPPTPEKRNASTTSGPQGDGYKPSPAQKAKDDAAAKRQRQADERRRELERKWKDAVPKAQAAIADYVAKLPIARVVAGLERLHHASVVKKARTADDYARATAVYEGTLGTSSVDNMHYHSKRFGFDLKKWFAEHVKAAKTAAPAKAAKKAKR